MMYTRACLLLALILLMTGCGSESERTEERTDDARITVRNAWVRVMPDSLATRTAVYGEITNNGEAADELVDVEVDVAASIELHETTIVEDVMRMREVETLAIAPGATVSLEPGGLHIMLIGMERQLTEGDSLELDLRFASGESVTVTAPARSQ